MKYFNGIILIVFSSVSSVYTWTHLVEIKRPSSINPNRKSPSELDREIFKNYDKNVRPVKEFTDVVITKIGISPLFISEVDEIKEIMVMDTWITMEWKDNYLTWNPDDHDGIKYLNVPNSEIWKPDITTYSASTDKKLLPQVFTNVMVYASGEVLWVPPLTISSRCPLDMSRYPYDTQQCVIKFGSWTFGKSAVDLQMYHPVVSLDTFVDSNPDWAMIGATAQRIDNYYPCCPNESFPSINFNVTLKRKQAAPVKIARSISYFAIFLGLLMFWLPPDSVYKILLGALADIFLGITVLYLGTVVASPVARLNAAGKIYPMMCAVSGAIIAEVLVMNLARIMGPCRPSRCLLVAAKGCCTMFCVCISRPKHVADNMVEAGTKETEKKFDLTAQEEWHLVATALDRLMFVAAVILTIFFHKFW